MAVKLFPAPGCLQPLFDSLSGDSPPPPSLRPSFISSFPSFHPPTYTPHLHTTTKQTQTQILAMVRFLPVLRDMSGGRALTFADLSSFTQFFAFDCVLPASPANLATTRVLLSAFGVPTLLFLGFLILWMALWVLHRGGSALHRRLTDVEHSSSATASSSSYFSDLPQIVKPSSQPQCVSGSECMPPDAAGSPAADADAAAAAGAGAEAGNSNNSSSGPNMNSSRVISSHSSNSSSTFCTFPASAAAEDDAAATARSPFSLAAAAGKNRSGTGSNHKSRRGGSSVSMSSMSIGGSGSGSKSNRRGGGSSLALPSWTLPAAASSFISNSTVSSLEKVGAARPPVTLREYLPVRLIITAGILGYACFSLFTSSMLQVGTQPEVVGLPGWWWWLRAGPCCVNLRGRNCLAVAFLFCMLTFCYGQIEAAFTRCYTVAPCQYLMCAC